MPEVLWMGQEGFREYTLKDLRTDLARVPEIVAGETGITTLPFPMRLVEGLTEKDVDRIFEASGRFSTKYMARFETFLNINRVFIAENRLEQATKILDWMKHFEAKDVPSAPLFFIPARTFLLLRDENQGWITKVGEQAKKELAGAMKQSKDDEKDLEKVRRLIGEEGYREAVKKAQWAAEGPSVKDIMNSYGTFAYRGGAIPSFVYWAMKGLARLVKEREGWYRDTLKGLLEAWGIPATDGDLRQRKYRKKKGT